MDPCLALKSADWLDQWFPAYPWHPIARKMPFLAAINARSRCYFNFCSSQAGLWSATSWFRDTHCRVARSCQVSPDLFLCRSSCQQLALGQELGNFLRFTFCVICSVLRCCREFLFQPAWVDFLWLLRKVQVFVGGTMPCGGPCYRYLALCQNF